MRKPIPGRCAAWLAGCAFAALARRPDPLSQTSIGFREPGPDHARGAAAQLAQKKLEQSFRSAAGVAELGEQIKKIQEASRGTP